MNVDSKTKKIEYAYELEDTKSTIEIEEPKELKVGKNTINFKVKAEDGTEVTYTLIINKEKEIVEEKEEADKEETEDLTFVDYLITILFFGALGGIGGALAYFTNRPKK